MTEIELFNRYKDELIEVCELLYEELPLSKKQFKRGTLGFTFQLYENLTNVFKVGLNTIILLSDEATVSKLFAQIREFYDYFCSMKKLHWECDAPCTPELAYAITTFTRFSTEVIHFSKELR